MRVTQLYVYPIKALRPACITEAVVDGQGLQHDRRFMLVQVGPDGGHRNVQIENFPECTRLFPAIEGDEIVVEYHPPAAADAAAAAAAPPPAPLRIPLRPDTAGLATIDITLMDSTATAYRMADEYGAWFAACLGWEAILVYLGDGRRPVLDHSPRQEREWERRQRQEQQKSESQNKGWLSSVASYVMGGGDADQTGEKEEGEDHGDEEPAWLSFNEAAPLLVVTEASLADVSARIADIPATESVVKDDDDGGVCTDAGGQGQGGDQPQQPPQQLNMMRFRPNIVVDGLEAWDEDFWGEVLIGNSRHGDDTAGVGDGDDQKRQHRQNGGGATATRPTRLALTANCARCMSINIDYATGRRAEGEAGVVLKRMMRDRRVDTGNRWSPIFGRYAHPLLQRAGGGGGGGGGTPDAKSVHVVSVGDEVTVTRRNGERSVWRWP